MGKCSLENYSVFVIRAFLSSLKGARPNNGHCDFNSGVLHEKQLRKMAFCIRIHHKQGDFPGDNRNKNVSLTPNTHKG